MEQSYDRFLGKEVVITHKSGMMDFGKLTLIKEHKYWKGVKGYKYCLNGSVYKMRSIKSIKLSK